MKHLEIIMARAHALLPASASSNPDAYDNAMHELEHAVRRALGMTVTEPTDPYVGLPVRAVMEGATFTPFDVPDDVPVRLHPDMVQMMDDMAGFSVGLKTS